MTANARLTGTPPSIQVWLIAGLPLLEVFFIALSYDALTLSEAEDVGWTAWFAYSGYVLKTLLAMSAALLLGIGPRFADHWAQLGQETRRYRYLGLHLGIFVALWLTTGAIFSPASVAAPPPVWIPVIWVILILLTFASWMATLANRDYWYAVARQERASLLVALAMGPLALIVAMSAQTLWQPFSAWTLSLSAWLLQLVTQDAYINYSEVLLGSGDFIVRIDQTCSGYEGVGLITFFTAFYLSLFRRDFRFPHALLLFPLGIATIWCFNAIRIVALILIGAEISPDIAIGGFHSQAGWIMFIGVAFGLLLSADRIRFFSNKQSSAPVEAANPAAGQATAMLMPLIVLLATTLLTQAFSAGHDWLYPLRVVATGFAIWWAWQHLRPNLRLPSLSVWPVGAGVLVFALWLIMVPASSADSARTAAALAEAPLWLTIAWLTLRSIGAVLTVPIAEELFFRGYLLHRLSGASFDHRLPFSWLAFLTSSVLFGLLHDAWAAGMAAGLVYGAVRYYRDNLSDAIIAHGTTNLLLSIYVMATGTWALW